MLVPLEKAGIGATGHSFKIDGVAFLNVGLRKEDGTFYQLEYEPVVISPDIMECYYGLLTEERFEKVVRDKKKNTLTYVTKEGTEEIKLKYFVTSETSVSSIKVAKTTIIPSKTVSVVKGRYSEFGNVKKEGSYALLVDESDTNAVSIPDVVIDSVSKRHLNFTIENNSDTQLKLKKGEI